MKSLPCINIKLSMSDFNYKNEISRYTVYLIYKNTILGMKNRRN